MTGILYQTPLCLLPAWTLLKFYYLIIFVKSRNLLFLTDFGCSFLLLIHIQVV